MEYGCYSIYNEGVKNNNLLNDLKHKKSKEVQKRTCISRKKYVVAILDSYKFKKEKRFQENKR